MEKIEYKIIKVKGFKGQRYETYNIEKRIMHDNGEIEMRYRTFVPEIEGNINTIDLNKLYFPKPITLKEWEKLSSEYHKAWYDGTLTEELECLREKESVA